MPTTPNRGWIYPSLEQNPYFETIEDFFLAQDTDMHATITGVRTVATGGTGASTLATGAYLRGAGTGAITTQAIPIPVAHGGTGATTGAIAPTIIDAKGDLIVGSAADTPVRMAAGAGGTVLLSDPASATGLAWGNTRVHLARITDGATVVNTAAETLLQAFTIPAGYMSQTGATLRVYASGTTAMAVACTLGLRIKITSPVLIGLSDSVLSVGVTAGTHWVVTGGAITRTAGSSGVLIGETGLFGVVFSGITPSFRYGATGLDLTAVLQGQVTAQMSTADAGNTVTLTTCTVEIDYATGTF